jgi:hypothetical protein
MPVPPSFFRVRAKRGGVFDLGGRPTLLSAKPEVKPNSVIPTGAGAPATAQWRNLLSPPPGHSRLFHSQNLIHVTNNLYRGFQKAQARLMCAASPNQPSPTHPKERPPAELETPCFPIFCPQVLPSQYFVDTSRYPRLETCEE